MSRPARLTTGCLDRKQFRLGRCTVTFGEDIRSISRAMTRLQSIR